MKAVTKTRMVVGVITIAVVLAMALPALSMFYDEDGIGFNMEIGSESVFEVNGDTVVSSLERNLNSSYEEGATMVQYGGFSKPIGSDNRSVAESIIGLATSSGTSVIAKAVNGSGNTVMIDIVDESTEDTQVFVTKITTSPFAAKTIEPSMKLYFLKDRFEAVTDSNLEVEDGVVKIRISLPMATFVMAQALGCDMIMELSVNYLKMMSFNAELDLGNMSGAQSSVVISGGVETVTIDLSGSSDAEMYLSYFEGFASPGTEINGIPLYIDVDSANGKATISCPVGTATLSKCLEDSLSSYDGCLVISDGDPDNTLTIDADQAGDIIGLIAALEESA